jgi:TetR/AcrR family transcriptional regulator, transcriptional repressor for nem operon
MTRTKPAEERRSDLMAAAKKLFVSKGIASTTLEEITDGAGVSKGLFYVYFGSKEELVCALQENFSMHFARCLTEAAETKVDWGEKLDACAQASFEAYRDWSDLHEVLFHRSGPARETCPDREPAHFLVVRAIRELLEQGIDAGAYEIEDPETTATILYVAMHAFDRTIYGGRPPKDQDVVKATKQLFRRAAGLH